MAISQINRLVARAYFATADRFFFCGSQKTSYPPMNLDLGMHILFPSTNPQSTPRLTINCPDGPLAICSTAANASSCCPWIPIPHCKLPDNKLPASFFLLKMPSQFCGHFSFPPSSNTSPTAMGSIVTALKFMSVLTPEGGLILEIGFADVVTMKSYWIRESSKSTTPGILRKREIWTLCLLP